MNKNILISGWPGAGVTTITGIVSYSLDKKPLRGTESFRYIWNQLGYEQTGLDAAEVEKVVQPYYGMLYDKYIDSKLQSCEGIIIESDIGGFRVGKKEEYRSIFVTASDDVRARRLGDDGRSQDTKVREESLRIEYKKLHGFDWFDMKAIEDTYDLVLDNSNLSISDELNRIYEFLSVQDFISKNKLLELKDNLQMEEKRYYDKGKNWYFEKLAEDGNIIPAEETIISIRNMFRDEVGEFPDMLKKVINAV